MRDGTYRAYRTYETSGAGSLETGESGGHVVLEGAADWEEFFDL